MRGFSQRCLSVSTSWASRRGAYCVTPFPLCALAVCVSWSAPIACRVYTLSTFTIDEYRWAIATLWSRFVSVKTAGGYVKAMVPFFDMLNHNPHAKSHHEFDEKTQCLKFVADQVWAAGKPAAL